jgi:hypothetical protein
VVAAVATGGIIKTTMLFDRFFQPAEYVELNPSAVSPEILRPPRFRCSDHPADEIEQGVVFFPVHRVLPAQDVILTSARWFLDLQEYFGISGRNYQGSFKRQS